MGFKSVTRKLTIISMMIMISLSLSSQVNKETKAIFAQAESHYLFGEYELANPLFLILNELLPENANIKYKIGNCYLNIPFEKAKAIPFLEEAVKNTNFLSKTDQLKENSAPLDAYVSLANAYRINDELEKAINTYNLFNTKARESGEMTNQEFVDQQITACRNAIENYKNPVEIFEDNLGARINQGSINSNAAVSYDGNTLVYTEKRGIENVIFFTRKERDRWQEPVDITQMIGAGVDCTTSALNRDGTELYLYKSDNFDGNIYVSYYVNDSWSRITKLNRNINTKFFESHASVSRDGNTLYFTSNRDGGQGGLDIYVSQKDATGNWGEAKNMGPTINTAYNEETPFITANDSLLYFSSEGHNSMGGYDIYFSRFERNIWTKPQNLGSPLNSTDDDIFFLPFNNGGNAYFSMVTDYKKLDIMYLGIGNPLTPHTFEIKGLFSLSDTTIRFNENFVVRLLNQPKGDTLDSSYPNEISGLYNFIVPQGNYRLVFSGTGYLPQTIDTVISSDSPNNALVINVVLKPDPNYIKPLTIINPVVYEKIVLANAPRISEVDSSTLITNVVVTDAGEAGDGRDDEKVLYFTVQVMALLNPVDVGYFRGINDMKVLYNDKDKFYRYTTGQFQTREEAYAHRASLISRGYPDEIFVKKVSKE